MTNIKLTVTGAQARASVTGPLTSGMVGLPVAIEYDEAWDALTKNLICRCSPWGSIDGENRAILNVGETASVAHEVMLPDRYLYLGLEGFREDGTLVIPTTWACCGKIVHGANTCEDPSTAPSLSVWNQLQVEMEQLQEQALTQEQAAELQACALEARQAAEEAKEAAASADSALTSDERSSLIAIVNAIGTFSVPNGQELMDAFNTAWSGSGDTGGDSGGEDSGGSGGDAGGDNTETPLGVAWTEGIFLSGGTEYPNATFVASDYVDGNGYSNVSVSNDTGKLFQIAVSFYDAEKTYLSSNDKQYVQGTAAYPSPLVIPFPEGTAYIRLSTQIQAGTATAGFVRYDELTYELV